MKCSFKLRGFRTITALLFLVVGFFHLSFSQTLKDTSFCEIIEQSNVLTLQRWETKAVPIFCVVTSHSDTESSPGDTIPYQRLSFLKKQDSGYIKIQDFEEMNFLNMFHLYDGNLMTIWMSGSGAFVKIFTVNSVGKVELALDEGVKAMPEFVEVGREQVILLSSGSAFEKGSNFVYPETADIYKWNGKSYELIQTVPWKTRFEALGKMK